MKNHPRRKHSSIWLAYTTLGLTAALVACASFLPDLRLWGLNHLWFHNPVARIVLFVVIALTFVPFFSGRVYAGLEHSYRAIRARRRGRVITAVVVAVMLFLFLWQGSATFLLGDGLFILNNMSIAAEQQMTPGSYLRDVTLAKASWTLQSANRTSATINPGADLLNLCASYVFRNDFGAAPLTGVRVVGAVMGAVLVLVLLVFLRRSDGSSMWPMCAALLVLGSGAMQIFSGYIENYSPSLLVGIVYVFAAHRVLSGKGNIFQPLVLFIIAFLMHAQGLLLAPSMGLLIAWTLWTRKRPQQTGLVWKVIVAVTVVAAVVALSTGPRGTYLLALAGQPYSVFSLSHMLDIFNELSLVVPAGLSICVLWWLSSREERAHGDRAFAGFAWCLAVPGILFLLLFRPDLGMARDWDLFSFAALGVALPVIMGLRRFLGDNTLRAHHSRLVVPILAMSLVLTFSWITINANEKKSVRRFEWLLQHNTRGAGVAYETLARYHELKGDYEAHQQALENAYQASRNPRYKLKLAWIRRDIPMAVRAMRSMVANNPANDSVRGQLLIVLMKRGEAEEVIKIASEGMLYSPKNPYFPFYIARMLMVQGKIGEAVTYLEMCEELEPSTEMKHEVDKLKREARRRMENEQ